MGWENSAANPQGIEKHLSELKIGFLLQRATDLKSMGPLAMECLKAGHQALLFYFDEVAQGKAYLKVREEQLEELHNRKAISIEIRKADLELLAKNHKLDFLIVQEGYHSLNKELQALQELRDQGVRLISLSHFFEITKRPLEALALFDKTFYISEYARDLHFELQASEAEREEVKRQLGATYAVAGSPMFDQIPGIERERARKELGIANEGRVVLLMAPVISPITPWRFHVWRYESKAGRLRDAVKAGKLGWLWEILMGETFAESFQEIQAFCKRNDAMLIVKSRGKQEKSEFLEEEADLFFDGFEDEYFPKFSTYTLLAAADLCITVNSMAAAEAAAMGVACVNIYVPHDDRAAASTRSKDAYNQILLGSAVGSLMNFKGAIKKIDHREAGKVFRLSKWEDLAFKSFGKEAYAEKFLGIEKQSSSQRILTIIEGMRKERLN